MTRKSIGLSLVLVLLFAGGAAAADLLHHVTLRPGRCVTVGQTRVCAARARTVTRRQTVTEWQTVTSSPAPPAPASIGVTDAYLNTGQNDQTSRLAQFYSVYPSLSGNVGVPPILHLEFAAPLVGNHDIQVSCHAYSNGSGTTFHVTAASGWQYMYTQLPGPQCDYYLTSYEVTVWLDGSPTSVDLKYSVVAAP